MREMKNIIDNTLKKLGLKNRALEYKVLEIWETAMGDSITKHASVHAMHRGVLFVHVDHPAWIQHLNFAAMDIKNRLNDAVGAKVVKEIRFQAGNRCNKQKNYQDTNNVEPVSANLSVEELADIEYMVQEIEDPEIRNTTASFIKHGKKLNLCKQKIGWTACPECGVLVDPKEKKCFHCNLKNIQALRRKTKSILWDLPWLAFYEISPHVQDLDEETYQEIRKEMIQELWEQFRLAAKNPQFMRIPKAQIQTYVMLRTGLSPAKLTYEIIWQTLGENMANKLLGGQ